MGLLGSIFKGVLGAAAGFATGGPVGAVAGGVSGLAGGLSADSGKKAIKNATQAQLAAEQAALDETKRQFDVTQGNLAPWLAAGKQALGGQSDLLGLNGAPQQQTAIDQLQASPYYQSLYRNGEEAVLANASATGGLRGGNTQRSLANFGADTLAQTIQQMLASLGGLSGQGASTGSDLGRLGSASSGTIADLLQRQGQTSASGALASGAVDTSSINSLFSSLGRFLPQGGGTYNPFGTPFSSYTQAPKIGPSVANAGSLFSPGSVSVPDLGSYAGLSF